MDVVQSLKMRRCSRNAYNCSEQFRSETTSNEVDAGDENLSFTAFRTVEKMGKILKVGFPQKSCYVGRC